jgi:methyltransferase (TIGR00027 family)
MQRLRGLAGEDRALYAIRAGCNCGLRMAIADISDTARWMAYARAMESGRPDALFHDPYALQLAGERGAALAHELGAAELVARGIAVRTTVLDELILAQVAQGGADLVLDLAAGLDTRPWRLPLPTALRWIDVDLPDLVNHKAGVLAGERPACRYESLQADVADPSARARVLAHCAGARRVLVVTEGFLVYLAPDQVTGLARDLHAQPSIAWWLTDVTGPRALEMLQRIWGPLLGGAQFRFGPADSAAFFARLGWHELAFRSSQQEARRLNRAAPATLLSRLLTLFASEATREEFRRLSGVALLSRDPRPGAP